MKVRKLVFACFAVVVLVTVIATSIVAREKVTDAMVKKGTVSEEEAAGHQKVGSADDKPEGERNLRAAEHSTPAPPPVISRTVKVPLWKSYPVVEPVGRKRSRIMCHTVPDATKTRETWKPPKFVYDHDLATKPKLSKVVVVIYNPVLEAEGGKTMIEFLKANDPWKYSHMLAKAINIASGGYINYKIVKFIEIDGYSEKIDGFRYTDKSFLDARKTNKYHRPDRSSYRKIFEENDLIDMIKSGQCHEVWLWGAGYFGYDELAMYIPNRYGRFAPTDNPWFYRPYEIPPECGRTVWVMGFNYQVGPDNMIHSYSHRVESIIALQCGRGVWKKEYRGKDPWNTFSSLEMDNPGKPSHVGNCHVPPNGQGGYDYNNKRSVLSYADNWLHYPDLRGEPRMIGSDEWNNNQYGYQLWWHSHLPKGPGYTKWGYNNWWVYIANTDEDLPDLPIPAMPIYPREK